MSRTTVVIRSCDSCGREMNGKDGAEMNVKEIGHRGRGTLLADLCARCSPIAKKKLPDLLKGLAH
jgi:hypothetical protein